MNSLINYRNRIKQLFQIMCEVRSPFVYFFDYFRLFKGTAVMGLRGGLKFKIRFGTMDRGAINEVCIYKIYNKKGFDIEPEDTIIDIGAHIGTFTIFASKLAKHGRVYAFEPAKNNFQILSQNIKLNKIRNAFPYELGVSSKSGKKILYFPDGKLTDAPSFYKMHVKMKKVAIPVISLKDLVKQNGIKKVDFLKIDCEGGEYEILYGCPKEVLNKVEKISMEYHNINAARARKGMSQTVNQEYNSESLIRFLKKNGFKVTAEPIDERRGLIYAKR